MPVLNSHNFELIRIETVNIPAHDFVVQRWIFILDVSGAANLTIKLTVIKERLPWVSVLEKANFEESPRVSLNLLWTEVKLKIIP